MKGKIYTLHTALMAVLFFAVLPLPSLEARIPNQPVLLMAFTPLKPLPPIGKNNGKIIRHIALYDQVDAMKEELIVDEEEEWWKSGVIYIGEGELLPIEEFCKVIFPFLGKAYSGSQQVQIESVIRKELKRLDKEITDIVFSEDISNGLLKISIINIGYILTPPSSKKPTKPKIQEKPAKPTVTPKPEATLLATKEKKTDPKETEPKKAKPIRGYAILGYSTLLNSYGAKPTPEEFIKFVRVRYVPDRESLENNVRHTLGKPVTMETLNEVKKIIMTHYEKNNHPVLKIVIPEQQVDDGVPQFIMTEGIYSTMKIRGNEHFTEEQIKSLFKIEKGKEVKPDEIEKTVKHYNQNPFLTMKTVLEPGTARGDTDIDVIVKDQRPWNAFIRADNYGSKLTGKKRVSAGFTYGNFNGPSHVLSYLYLTDKDFDRMHAHSLSYTNLLPWNHTLTLTGVISSAESVFDIPELSQEGSSFNFGMLYKIPLKKVFSNYTQNFYAGADFKQSNSSLFFNSLNITNTLTDVVQFSTAYEGMLSDSYGYTSFRLSGHTAPGGWTNHSGQGTYSRVGYGSATYHFLRLELNRATRLPANMELATRISGQISTTKLPASEQMGGGGHASIRGYDEREASGDRGLLISNEIRTKFFALNTEYYPSEFSDNFYWGSNYNYHWGEIQLLAFLDYANLHTHSPGIGDINPNVDFLSAGIGFRYRYKEYATLNFDYGWQLKNSNASELTRDKNDSRGHLYFEAKF